MISIGGILNLKAEVCWKTTLTLFPSASVPLTKRMNIVAQSIYFEDKAETSEPPNKKEEFCHNPIKNMRKNLEHSDSLFKATRAELEQQEAERKQLL